MNVGRASRLLIPTLFVTLAAYAGSPLDGKWTGKTSQGEVISFEIEDGAISKVTISWKVPLDEPCTTGTGSPLAITVLGGEETLYFPYTAKQFERMKNAGETRIDPSTVRPAIQQNKFKIDRDLGGRARLHLSARVEAGRSFTGDATVKATTCKGSQELSWSAKRAE